MPDALEQLKSRLGDHQSLDALAYLLAWDQRTVTPPGGFRHRADHIALLQRLTHQMLIDPEVGRLLDELESRSLDPDSWDGALVRVARRDYQKAVQVPVELSSEMARAAAESAPGWLEAKATSNFDLFLPLMERNVDLRHRYVECFGPQAERYDVLLDDFEPGMKTAEVSRIFAEIKPELVQLISDLRDRDVDDLFSSATSTSTSKLRSTTKSSICSATARRPGESIRRSTLRVRLGRRRHPHHDALRHGRVEVLFSTMHEYGHGLYQHQLPREWAHLPVGTGDRPRHARVAEPALGESRRSQPSVLAVLLSAATGALPEAVPRYRVEQFYAAINKSQPSLIRIEADEVTYGMHVILRFELEQDIINGRIEFKDLPELWAQKMHDYLGIEVPTMRTACCRTCTGRRV